MGEIGRVIGVDHNRSQDHHNSCYDLCEFGNQVCQVLAIDLY